MSSTVIEMAEIKLAAGKTEADLLEASNRFQEEFLSVQPGFLGRELVRKEDGQYADIVRWASMEDAAAIMEKAATSPACGGYFSVMEFNPENPDAGVSHFGVLSSYVKN